ncbi:hypothetical protein [Streptomyces sp. NBC_00286]|uniref:hypothetical protein n=1 Tax=Streptomyces sp. NBC_00286 TaxID=2975701 RepID=UPI002E2B3646|nr:hypothetical protein [Streptomyces sp. NBC_00286]
MPISLWIVAVMIPEVLVSCVLMRWLPAKHERWIPLTLIPAIAALAVTLHFITGTPWPATLTACAGFLWGIALALLPFRGWISSWTLPVHGEARLRWREVVLLVPTALTPLSTTRTDAAMKKALAVRQVVRARGPFPPLMGVALLVLPVAGAAAARWAFDVL